MAARSTLNYIGFGDNTPDTYGTYDAKYSSCGCQRRLLQHPTKPKSLMCPACGQETMTEEQAQKDEKLKSKHGKKGKTKSFIVSYDPRKNAKTFYEEECQLQAGYITS